MSLYDSNCDYNKYKIFYAVAECNSFSKAVDVLHISQPAISYAIKELESQLNTELFIRENRTIKLTDDGEKLMVYLRRAFNEINIAEKILKEQKNDLVGTIKFGLYQHLAVMFVPDLLEKFTKNNPNVKFEIITSSSEELKEKLRNRELDFIITQYPLFTENSEIFTEEKLLELENCFFTNKYYYDLYVKKELKEIPLLLPFRGYVDIDMLDKILKDSSIKVVNNFRIYALGLSKKLVEKNLGIGWGPRKCIETELKNKELYEIDFGFDAPSTKFSISYNKKALNKSTRDFIKFLKEEMKNID